MMDLFVMQQGGFSAASSSELFKGPSADLFSAPMPTRDGDIHVPSTLEEV